MPREIQAFSFQTELTFREAMKRLRAGEEGVPKPLGDWYERDSAWYDNLLSRRGLADVKMNLYFFDEENVLEIKFGDSAPPASEIEEYALKVLLPTLEAQGIEPCESVD